MNRAGSIDRENQADVSSPQNNELSILDWHFGGRKAGDVLLLLGEHQAGEAGGGVISGKNKTRGYSGREEHQEGEEPQLCFLLLISPSRPQRGDWSCNRWRTEVS